MESTQKVSVVRILLGFIIFALLIGVKIIIMANLENLGFSYFDANQIRNSWNTFSLEYIYMLGAILISMVIALKFNIKA